LAARRGCRAIEVAQARDMILTGKRMQASRAQAIGLITRLVPREELTQGEFLARHDGAGGHATPIIGQMYRECAAALRSPGIAEGLRSRGFDIEATTPDHYAQKIAHDLRRWGILHTGSISGAGRAG
jgi:enoyl-CoA hydratase/carnithine racemase